MTVIGLTIDDSSGCKRVELYGCKDKVREHA